MGCTTSRLSLAVGLLTASELFAPTALGADDSPVVVIRGAQSEGPVTPGVFDGDLRALPKARAWKPGDPIVERPSRRQYNTRLPPQAGGQGFGTVEPDPLLAEQQALTLSLRTFSPPGLNFNGQGFTGFRPPDPVGDVGPYQYIQAVNHADGTSLTVYDNTQGT